MHYFVTGATGFIGGHLAQRLLDDGHRVTALVRDPKRAERLAERGADIVTGDITDKTSMRDAMRGVDGVYHLAAWYKIGSRDRAAAYRINVEGTRNVLELMRELEVPKGVYTSTIAIYGDTGGRLVDESYRPDTSKGFISEYDRTKYLAHFEVARPLMAEGLPLVNALPGLVYGPDDPSPMGRTLRQYLQQKLPLLPRGTAYAWAHVDDIATGHMLAMERGQVGEDYIIAGPVHTLIEGFELAERLTGVPAPKRHASPAMLRTLARVTAILDRIMPLPETYHPETLRATAGVTYIASNAKAKRELGYEPRPLEQGLAETLEHEMAKLGMARPQTAAAEGAA